MKCKIPFVELPNSFPKSDVDVYRVLEEDGKYYIRLELDGKPMYLTFSANDSLALQGIVRNGLKGGD